MIDLFHGITARLFSVNYIFGFVRQRANSRLIFVRQTSARHWNRWKVEKWCQPDTELIGKGTYILFSINGNECLEIHNKTQPNSTTEKFYKMINKLIDSNFLPLFNHIFSIVAEPHWLSHSHCCCLQRLPNFVSIFYSRYIFSGYPFPPITSLT